jgi:quinolinate synthase
MKNHCDGDKIIEKILKIKESLGESLLILTHHYQRKEIVNLGNYCGDSFSLSQKAAGDTAARYIVFCGVHFMAESAAILAQPSQTVQIPDIEAGCWMADMADIYLVERAWEEISSIINEESIIPIVYVNSEASIKAFCGRHGGITCTSSNALAAFRWGYNQQQKILFLPDQYLGRNTGNQMRIQPDKTIVWSPDKPLGGNTPEQIKKAELILWDGYCLVHARFSGKHILKVREKYPEAKIIVHPECTQEVVGLADAVGSTSFIVKYVENSPVNSTIFVGTEINLINRLSLEHTDKKVMDLHYSLCPNMFKINLKNLLWTLENIGQVNVIAVPEEVKTEARKALDRMLNLEK